MGVCSSQSFVIWEHNPVPNHPYGVEGRDIIIHLFKLSPDVIGEWPSVHPRRTTDPRIDPDNWTPESSRCATGKVPQRIRRRWVPSPYLSVRGRTSDFLVTWVPVRKLCKDLLAKVLYFLFSFVYWVLTSFLPLSLFLTPILGLGKSRSLR